jgi:hypothetical protein
LRRWAIFAGLYCGSLVVVSAVQPSEVIAVGQRQCFDEWCLAVDGATRQSIIGRAHARGDYVIVTLRILNDGRGRRQRERDVYAELRDESGALYRQSVEGQSALAQATGDMARLTDSIDAGTSKRVELVFDVAKENRSFALIAKHAWFPHALIIGDPESLFHRPTVVPLVNPPRSGAQRRLRSVGSPAGTSARVQPRSSCPFPTGIVQLV